MSIIAAFIAIILAWSAPVICQNLIPNPGFEEFLDEPKYSPTINAAPEWFTIKGTPDFYHRQYQFPNSVPDNFRGLQEPASGDGYAGVISYTGGATRELIGIELVEPLKAEQVYQLTFKVSLSGRSKFATDDIGAVLIKGTKDSLGVQSISVRNAEGNIISDTANWTTISGRYLAEGGENILGIGNFAIGDGKVINSDGDGWAYFYIDDIELTEVCPNFTLEHHDVPTPICDGTTIELHGELNADSYNWIGQHTFAKLQAKDEGNYTVNSYFDCSIIQTQYQIMFEPCDCSLKVPSIISQVNNLIVHPAENVRSFEFYLVDVWGRLVYSISSQEAVTGTTPDVSAPYFWKARLSCITARDQIIERIIAGKLVIQN